MKNVESVFKLKRAKSFLELANDCKLDVKALKKEVLALHEDRLAPKLGANKLTLKAMQKAIAKEIGTRSRVLSIFMDVNSALSDINAMREATIMWAVNEHADLMPVNTKTEQRSWLGRGFDLRAPILPELRKLKETANYILDDVDKAAWGVKSLMSTFELSTRPEMVG